MSDQGPSIFDLSPSEKLQLVEDLWDDLASRVPRRPCLSTSGKSRSWRAEKPVLRRTRWQGFPGTQLSKECAARMPASPDRTPGGPSYRAVQGDGLHLAPSASFLKCVLVTNVCWRY
jgi:hypothetical protein